MKDDTLVEKSIVGFILLVGKARQGFRGVASGGPDIRRGKSPFCVRLFRFSLTGT